MTLVELLAVISVVLVLAGLLIANLSRIQGTMARSSCLVKLRGLGSAIASYSSDNNNLFPGFGKNSRSRWLHQIAPYLGYESDGQFEGVFFCSNAYDFKDFVCPASKLWKKPPSTLAEGIYGINRNFIGNPAAGTPSSGSMTGISRALVTQPASTILLGDKYDGSPAMRISTPEPWYPADPSGASANHRSDLSPANGPTGAQNYLYVDGHAETLDGFPGLEAFALEKQPK